MKATLHPFIVAIGLSSMATASPLNRVVKRHEIEQSSTDTLEDNRYGWTYNHSTPPFAKTKDTHDPTDTAGIMRVLIQTSLTQTGPTLVNRDEDATTSSPSPTTSTISDFRPREAIGFDTSHFTAVSKPSVTWNVTHSHNHSYTRSHRPNHTYTSYAHMNPPQRPTTSAAPIARDLQGDSNESDTNDDDDDSWDTATRLATETHDLNRRDPEVWITVVATSYVTHHPEVTRTEFLTTTVDPPTGTLQPSKPTTTSSPPPPPPPPPATASTAPSPTLTTRATTPPTIEPKSPTCPVAGTAGSNVWCLGGQTFALECDTALDPSSNNFGSITLPAQNWDMYGRCGALCADVPDSKCTGFSYIWASGLCYLKEGDGAKNKGGNKAEGIHSGRVVVLKEEEVGNCLGVKPRVGQFVGLSG
ncbi:hypothetical protein SMACR_05608 [Sordaria macrospora]|uniref:WGS project CABT00000000 data, contig 2.30 n=2 Tax=Sordaria macrospora TaxID=5147 RepID=F7W559_SORMK|nr:uncharacterized protein SMAC_05608 [Sordaria macrospora k-hell]KAA8630553.1 hypothetical protein SMACR_05608 [Sordaria macrospora]WPJ62520.1 hypothetical protein SMAC4_05608 [Sordaria macrospora]CCC12647.1 unnamed protein product [Sordaria macrospora k-hell]